MKKKNCGFGSCCVRITWMRQYGYDLSGNDGYPTYGIISVDIYPGEYELKE